MLSLLSMIHYHGSEIIITTIHQLLDTMKAIIIARVSTEEQREAGNSLPAQVTRLENYCKHKGFTIIKACSFDESAYN